MKTCICGRTAVKFKLGAWTCQTCLDREEARKHFRTAKPKRSVMKRYRWNEPAEVL